MNKNKELGCKIKLKIIELNLNQKEVARKMNVSSAALCRTLNKLINGNGITTTTLFKLCECLNISIKDLF